MDSEVPPENRVLAALADPFAECTAAEAVVGQIGPEQQVQNQRKNNVVVHPEATCVSLSEPDCRHFEASPVKKLTAICRT